MATSTGDEMEAFTGDDYVEEEEELVIEGVEGNDHCLICFTEDLPAERAIAPCGHSDFCAQCHLRLRRLHKDKKCPICKAENATIVVDSDMAVAADDDEDAPPILLHKTFEDYAIYGNNLGSNFVYREELGMFFPVQFYEECVLPLFSLRCGVPGCEFTNDKDTFVPAADESTKSQAQQQQNKKQEKKRLGGMKALNEHLKHKHGLALCLLCVDAKRDFVSQLPRFTPNQLRKHTAKGDGEDSGFKGHPVCQFCRPKSFYDITKVRSRIAETI
jgi:hypothetical protein